MSAKLYNGKTIKEWSELTGIKRKTIQYRLSKGWTIEDAVSVKVGYTENDLSGRRFGRLTATHRMENYRQYHCVCDCGNECIVDRCNLLTGRQQSCGCLNMQNRKARHKDMTGQIVNGVRVVKRIEDEVDSMGKHYVCYQFVCPHCGKLFNARFLNVKSGNTGGCGCTRNHNPHIDLSGKDFEFCHVNKRVENHIQPSGNEKVMYECTCCCGKIYTDWAHTIAHGRSNCGCKFVQSKGEELVKNWLDDNGIKYKQRHKFKDLKSDKNAYLFFDFALLDDENNVLGLIEFQGEQHYHEIKHSIKDFGKRQREDTDPMKRAYCKEKHYPLFEIAYTEKVPDRCQEIINLLYHDNTVPSGNIAM